MTRYVGNLVELAEAGRILENAPEQLLASPRSWVGVNRLQIIVLAKKLEMAIREERAEG
jgi:hypothetical protein